MEESTKKKITVAVTGGAPYDIWDFNTSSMIRDALPERIVREDDQTVIEILKYPYNIYCSYTDILERYPTLWNGKRSVYGADPSADADEPVHVDIMIHMGMAPEYKHFAFETEARRDGYERDGDDGVPLAKDALAGLPEKLKTDFNLHEAVTEIKEALDYPIETEVATDAKLYFCEFQFYNSMAELYRRGEFKRVVFFHVPKDTSDDAIGKGADVAKALIVALSKQIPENVKLPTEDE